MSNSNTPAPVSMDPMAKTFDGVSMSLVDLHRGCLQAGQQIISGRTFNNCRIEGPAIMLAVGGVNFDSTNFGRTNGDIRNIVLFPASPTSVIGAIPVENCSFIGCEFFGVGFTGSPDFTSQILALGNPK